MRISIAKRSSRRSLAPALLAAVLCLALPAGAGAQGTLGLRECIGMAQGASPRVERSQGYHDLAQAESTAADLRQWPRVNLDLTHQPKLDYFGRPLETDDVFDSEVKVTQPLWSPSVWASQDKAQAGFRRADASRAGAGLEVALEVVDTYYALLAAQELAVMRTGLVASARELVELSRKGVDRGLLLREDLLEAQARRMEIEYLVGESQSRAAEETQRLKLLMGLDPDQSLEVAAQAPAFRPPARAEELVELAMGKNPSLAASQAEAALSESEVVLAESRSESQVNLVGSYALEGDNFPGDNKYATVMLMWEMRFGEAGAKAFYGFQHLWENQAALYPEDQDLQQRGVSLSWLGSDDSSVVALARAKAQRHLAQADLREERRKLHDRIITLIEELKRHQVRGKAAAAQEELYAERVEIAKAKSSAGRGTPAQELEERMDWAEARAKVIEARHQAHAARATLALLSGQELGLRPMPLLTAAK